MVLLPVNQKVEHYRVIGVFNKLEEYVRVLKINRVSKNERGLFFVY